MMGLIGVVSLSSGCSLDDDAECQSDSDCADGESCIGQGVLVRDGICLADDFGEDRANQEDPNQEDPNQEPDCQGELVACGNQCVDPQEDVDHCGGCDNECEAPDAGEPFCNAGICDFSCHEDTERCDEDCVDTASDVTHCGQCDNPCDEGDACHDGVCGPPDCGEGEAFCDGSCVDITTSTEHCQECFNACDEDIAGASAVCEESSGCAYVCDDETQTLCEDAGLCTDTDEDDEHCGTCGNACGADETCVDGQCECAEGLVDCGGDCVDTDEDPQHCGGCGEACDSVEVCVAGSCTDDCPDGLSACSGTCVDLDTSVEHCQTCGNQCDADIAGASPLCTAQGCDYQCDDGSETLCEDEGVCANLATDDENCGTCGESCETNIDGAVAQCVSSTCELYCADSDEVLCDDEVCTDLESDDHCGECGNSCAAGENCFDGQCISDDECIPSALPFGGGEGSVSEPYRICSISHLESIGGQSSEDAYYELAEDLSFSATSWLPIGNQSSPFEGHFDGGGYTLDGLTISGSDSYRGLFGTIGASGEVRDVRLEDADIQGSQRVGVVAGRSYGLIENVEVVAAQVDATSFRVGGLVGELNDDAVLKDCIVEDSTVESDALFVGGGVGRAAAAVENLEISGTSVMGVEVVGGAAGLLRDTMEDSSADASVTVTGENYTGGLVGRIEGGGTLTNGESSATVVGENGTGGLVGFILDGTVEDSMSDATVEGEEGTGGLVGHMIEGNIENSSSTATVEGDLRVAGILGWGSDDSEVESSQAQGTVVATARSGGLVGWTSGTVEDSWSTATVTVNGEVGGGLVGELHGTVSRSWADATVDTDDVAGGLVGLSVGTIEESWSMGEATATDDYAGGLVGQVGTDGVVSDSYSGAEATASFIAGGLAGALVDGQLERTYAFGEVVVLDGGAGGLVGAPGGTVIIEDSYWDINTSEQGSSPPGGEGLNTSDFGLESSFPGWDFDDRWQIEEIDDGNDRPQLQWYAE